MADTNEEQLLSDLLRGISRQDARLEAPHLEARLMCAAERPAAVRLKADTTHWQTLHWRTRSWAVAAVVAAAVLATAISLVTRGLPAHTDQATTGRIAPVPVEASQKLARPSSPPGLTELTQPERRAGLTRRVRPATSVEPVSNPIAQSPGTQSDDEFVPLMPMTAQDLAGPFQIVRVQMPRASLGTLRSPLEHPNELVQADVLLGEDGMARAIRVSTSESTYPWRSR